VEREWVGSDVVLLAGGERNGHECVGSERPAGGGAWGPGGVLRKRRERGGRCVLHGGGERHEHRVDAGVADGDGERGLGEVRVERWRHDLRGHGGVLEPADLCDGE